MGYSLNGSHYYADHITCMGGATTRISESESGKETRNIDVAIHRAERYATEAWFPTIPEVFRFIRRNLRECQYFDKESLLEDIKKDFSLYTYILATISDSGELAEAGKDVLSILNALEFEQLENLIPKVEGKISSHSLNEISDVQSLRFQHMIITTVAAQEFARAAKLDHEKVYMAALVRQLGLTLVAWNYPRVYERAVTEGTSDEKDFTVTLRKLLGFAPTSLGIRIAETWNIPPAVWIAAIRRNGAVDVDEEVSRKVEDIRATGEGDTELRVCEIAEAFAKAFDSRHFPGAKKAWEDQYKREATKFLGNDTLKKLDQKINEVWEHYARSLPNVFPSEFSHFVESKVTISVYSRKLYESNIGIKKTPKSVQELILKVYAEISEGAPSAQGLRLLIHEVLPQLGFVSGCFYVFDGGKATLIPKVVVGKGDPKDFKPVSHASFGALSGSRIEMFMTKVPIRGETEKDDGRKMVYVVGAVGSDQKPGSLYLEASESDLLKRGCDPIQYFKIIRQVIADCLNIHGSDTLTAITNNSIVRLGM